MARGAAAEGMAGLLERVRALGEKAILPAADAVDREARFPAEALSALREERLLSAYVPRRLGGLGLTLSELAELSRTLGHYDASVAMIYAMHQIQVACMVHHSGGAAFFEDFLARLVREQRLVASATSEVGVGGDVRSSVCALEVHEGRFRVEKRAPVISYGADSDDILVTCRRLPEAPASDQVAVLVERSSIDLEKTSGWDTLGFRGTCSTGFVLRAEGAVERVLPEAFGEVLAQTMQPVAHLLWSSLWLGIAEDAAARARRFVRAQARRTGVQQAASLRLAELDAVLQTMRGNLRAVLSEYEALRAAGRLPEGFAFPIRVNNLKVTSSTLVVDVVSRAMLVCGIEGYRNDSPFSLARHLRDAYGAALMVNNDRIAQHNATLLLAQREGGLDG